MAACAGYDGAKKINGRKRHILVDTGGLVLTAKVHAADIQDRAAVPLVLDGMNSVFPRLEHLWVDQGYTGAGKTWIEGHLGWRVEVVQHPHVRRSGLIGRPDPASFSLILHRLGSYARQHSVHQALNEIGRVDRTVHILRTTDEEEYRRRQGRELNKGEAAHDLSRFLFFGK